MKEERNDKNSLKKGIDSGFSDSDTIFRHTKIKKP